MKFSLGDTGADSVNGGIRSIFQALTQAPMLRDQMAQKAALMNAQTYQSNMSGNKYGSEAAANEYTLGRRQAVPDVAPQGMPAYEYMGQKIFRDTGDTNAERVAQAMLHAQKAGNIDAVQAGRANPTATAQAYGAVSGSMPFDAVGSTGRSMNKLTGLGSIMEKTLAEMADSKTRSEIGENNAQAGNASASADRHRASTDLIKTKTSAVTAPGGKPLTAAQLRINAEIEEAREALAGMTEDEIGVLLKENPSFMSAGQRQTLDIVNKARKPKFGESDVPTTSPMPAPPKVEKPSTFGNFVNKVFGSKGEPAKSAGTPAVASTMGNDKAALLQQAQEAMARGAPRDKVLQRLKAMGVDTTGL